MEDNGYVDATEFLECQPIYMPGRYGGDGSPYPLYVGPQCASGGNEVKIGVFADETCRRPLEAQDVKNYLYTDDDKYLMKLSNAILKKIYDVDTTFFSGDDEGLNFLLEYAAPVPFADRFVASSGEDGIFISGSATGSETIRPEGVIIDPFSLNNVTDEGCFAINVTGCAGRDVVEVFEGMIEDLRGETGWGSRWGVDRELRFALCDVAYRDYDVTTGYIDLRSALIDMRRGPSDLSERGVVGLSEIRVPLVAGLDDALYHCEYMEFNYYDGNGQSAQEKVGTVILRDVLIGRTKPKDGCLDLCGMRVYNPCDGFGDDYDYDGGEYTICRSVDGAVSCENPEYSREESPLPRGMRRRDYLDLYLCPDDVHSESSSLDSGAENEDDEYEDELEDEHEDVEDEEYNFVLMSIVPHQCVIR